MQNVTIVEHGRAFSGFVDGVAEAETPKGRGMGRGCPPPYKGWGLGSQQMFASFQRKCCVFAHFNTLYTKQKQ